MQNKTRLSVRLSAQLMNKLNAYMKRLDIENLSRAVELFIISFVMNEAGYQSISDPMLNETSAETHSFSVSEKTAEQIRLVAERRGISLGECIRLAICYGIQEK